jgi:hypothetical protein
MIIKVRDWWFAPVYGTGTSHGMPERVFAETHDIAFRLARRTWPTADGWICLGRGYRIAN